MKRVLSILILGILFFVSCGDSSSKKKGKEKMSGKQVYTVHCAFCHGEDGNKGRVEAPSLSQSELSEQERILIIANGKSRMPAYNAILTREEINAVAKYTLSLK